MPKNKYNLLNNLEIKHSLLIKFDQFMSYYIVYVILHKEKIYLRTFTRFLKQAIYIRYARRRQFNFLVYGPDRPQFLANQ